MLPGLGYISILVAMKIKCPFKLLILAWLLRRSGGHQSILELKVRKGVLKDEAGLLAQYLMLLLFGGCR